MTSRGDVRIECYRHHQVATLSLERRCKKERDTEDKEDEPGSRFPQLFRAFHLRNEVCGCDVEKVPDPQRDEEVHTHGLSHDIRDNTAQRESEGGNKIV